MYFKGKTGLHGKLSSSKNGMDRGAEENCVTKREGCPLNNRVQGAQMQSNEKALRWVVTS